MHTNYRDIIERIQEPPRWWDEDAVPRYCDFSPEKIANIYAVEAALLLIACQFGPVHHFRVVVSRRSVSQSDLADEIRNRTIHYGDPPHVDWCDEAASNSVAIKVLEYWSRPWKRRPGRPEWSVEPSPWTRDSSLEIDVLTPNFEERRYPCPDWMADLSQGAEGPRPESEQRRHSKRGRHGRQSKG